LSKLPPPKQNSDANSHVQNYKIIKLLNQGGMGEIYLAEDTRLHRTVAIKKIKNELITNSHVNNESHGKDSLDNALNEARLLAKLNHPNIVQIYDIVPEEKQISLVMEYLNGKTLQSYQQEKIISLADKMVILSQISKALASAHAQNIIHCDLKPDNIIIDENAVVKIVDFGIAKLTNSNSKDASNLQNFGSQTAMSPEQLHNLLLSSKVDSHESKELNNINFQSDLFSLGIIAFQLISGEHPFAGNSVTATAQNILASEKSKTFSVEDIVPRLPNELITLLNKLLAFDPKNRPHCSDWVKNQFEQITKEIHQQAILNQDTLPLTADIAKKLAISTTDSEQSTVNITVAKIHSKKYNKLVTITVLLLMTILVIFGLNLITNNKYLFSPKAPITRYVVVLPAKVTHSDSENPIANMQKDLVTASINEAIRQSIINTKGLRLISHREANNAYRNAKGNISNIGAATGASDIITTELDCNNIRCNVTLSRLTVSEINKEKKWTVLAQQNWPTQLTAYKEISVASQNNINALYPDYVDTYLNVVAISEQGYKAYIQLYEQIKIQGVNNDSNLQKLEDLLSKNPYLYAGYSLFRESALAIYNETNNEKYPLRIERLIEKSPPEYKYSTFQAIDIFDIYLATGNTDEAEKQLNVIFSRGIDSSTLHELQGIFYLDVNNLEQAIEKFETALSLRPNTGVLYNLAIAYYYLGNLDSAKSTLHQQLQINPVAYEPNQLLAAIFLLEGNLAPAIASYERIIKINPQNTDVNNLSLAYSLSGRYQEALTMSQLAVNLSPNEPSSILNLADAEMLVGLTERAKVNYQKIITLHKDKDDTNLIALKDNAQAYVHLGHHNKAVKSISQAKKLAPNSGEIAFTAALVYSQLGEHISAINQVEEALKADIGNVWFNLPWFDNLCNKPRFSQLLANAGNEHRCSHD
jgi:serine/threonine-protein kinase